jgi:hypothetical protein
MIIMPVNDRSTDGTREIIDRIAARRPMSSALPPHGRQAGQGGCTERCNGHDRYRIFIVFDADYVRGAACSSNWWRRFSIRK